MSTQSNGSSLSYQDFLVKKTQVGGNSGFEPIWIPDIAFDFQKHLIDWSVRKGRASVWADCGLGKTLCQLSFGENVVRHTNKPFLVVAPLTVVAQTIREGEKFGIECVRSQDGKFPSGARIVVTNYNRLEHFNPNDFSGACIDEAGSLKDSESQRTALVKEFMRTLPYRLLCTATAAPNDYIEFGNSSECLGELGFQDMLTRFFRATKNDKYKHTRWGIVKYQLRPYAEDSFWRWLCSWARAVRKPSDLGFDDGPFVLPPLVTDEHVVCARTKRPGFLYDLPAITLQEQREERRRTLQERCEKAAELVSNTGRQSISWCSLNDEGDLLEKLIPGAVQISGRDSDESKEEKILAFVSGQIQKLVSKSVLLGWGLNLQCCSHITVFPDHSFERHYQLIRRCHRFGQKSSVKVDMVTSEGERGVLENLMGKMAKADHGFERLTALMNDHLHVQRSSQFTKTATVPAWLSNTRNGDAQ